MLGRVEGGDYLLGANPARPTDIYASRGSAASGGSGSGWGEGLGSGEGAGSGRSGVGGGCGISLPMRA